jgi:ribosomal protein S18 acetylase RimI-like enzyme
LEHTYPVARRIFIQNTFGNPYYEPGDGLVFQNRDEIVGFSLTRWDRRQERGTDRAALGVVLVDPRFQRRGIGSRLVRLLIQRIRRRGARFLGAGSPSLYRFWPGVPGDLQAAVSFFRALGWPLKGGIYDLIQDVGGIAFPDSMRLRAKEQGVNIRAARQEDLPGVIAFEREVFPYWSENFRMLATFGNADHIVIAEKAGRVVGSLCTYSPLSRHRAANLTWESLLGENVGGIGSVGIAPSERGRGLGTALCAHATTALKERGARNVVVDWTSRTGFYGKLGYRVWREYWMGELTLQRQLSSGGV